MTTEVFQTGVTREEVEADIIKFKVKLAEHIVKRHNGVPASTCHECLQWQQGIRSNQMVLSEFDRGTWKSKTQ